MYIKYSELFDILALFLPVEIRESVRKIGYDLKVWQNLNYIKNNKKRTLEKLKNKIKRKQKLNVAFYIYDETKWKVQSIYDLMEKSEYFVPHIFVSKNCAPKNNFNYKTKEDVIKTYNFFKEKGLRVQYAYDIDSENFISFEKMRPKPDIVYYCHPWYVYKTQGPVMASKYALTYYSPYAVSASTGEQEYILRFYLYIETQYILNNLIKDNFSMNMQNKGENLKVVGHPALDYFYLNKDKHYIDSNIIIYAPHFSVDENTTLKWGTFLEFGEYILQYAKNHPEFQFVLKPHPCLKDYLLIKNLWSKEQIDKYWNEWKKIGLVYESGDYLDLFMKSKAMITDCGSFKTEYFMTQKPQIWLKSKHGVQNNESVEKINQTSYKAENIDDLSHIFKEVLENNNDYKKELRQNLYKDFGYENNFAAKNILNDIEETVGI